MVRKISWCQNKVIEGGFVELKGQIFDYNPEDKTYNNSYIHSELLNIFYQELLESFDIIYQQIIYLDFYRKFIQYIVVCEELEEKQLLKIMGR